VGVIRQKSKPDNTCDSARWYAAATYGRIRLFSHASRDMPPECQHRLFRRLHQAVALAALLLAMPFAHASDNVYLIGGNVSPQADVRGNLYAAGGVVSITGRVAGSVTAAGGNITLTPGARIGGAWLTGATVAIGGTIDGNARLYARHVVILGTIDGNLRLVAQRIDILPGARIRGNLSYLSSSAIHVDPAAVISGTVTRTGGWLRSLQKWVAVPLPAGFHLDPVLYAGFFIVGALLALLFPKFTRNASGVLAHHPWASVALGLAIFVVTPPFIFMLLITVIGIPLAFLLLMVYSAVMLIGFLIALLAIGDRIGSVFRAAPPGFLLRMLWFAVALLLIMALRTALPAPGHVVALIVLLAGVGAFLLRLLRSYPDSA
jgi:cytoskeletal protein CcmA (bactofilin family)